jgi:small-conductance mechanosensitive channel
MASENSEHRGQRDAEQVRPDLALKQVQSSISESVSTTFIGICCLSLPAIGRSRQDFGGTDVISLMPKPKTIASWFTTSGIKILGILIGLIILSQMSRWIVKSMEKFVPEMDPLQAAEAKKRAHTLGNTLRHALLITISFVAILMILGELGIQLGPLLATAGIGALAIGFGAQSLVNDVINGLFIILENQYRIGDAIEVGGVSGLVESVSLRKTVLRDLDGKVHTIPNGEIKIVSNSSKEWSRRFWMSASLS